MVQACEQWVHAHGVPKMQLMVRKDNEASSPFERLSYTDAEVIVLGRRLDGAVP